VVILPRSLFDAVLLYDAIYADYTIESGTEGGIAFSLISKGGGSDSSLQKDFLYVGSEEPFGEIQFRFLEKGRNYSLKFECFNGADWVQLTESGHNLNDYTSNWMFDGPVRFVIPTEWARTTVNDANRFWIRISTTKDPLVVAKALQIFPKILQPNSELKEKVRQFLEPRRLLTTAVHVVGPRYLTIGVRITLVLMPDALKEMVRSRAVEELWRFFHPLTGGSDGAGWPFGRSVYVSEIYELLDTLPGVDYVKKSVDPGTSLPLDELTVESADSSRLKRNAEGELVGIEIFPDELVDADIVPDDIETETTNKI
jgi:hypothetical protein